MSDNVKMMTLDRVSPGDVLLCCGDGKIAGKIEAKTDSRYTHAAICTTSVEAVEAGLGGIEKADVAEIVSRYPFVAVFRQPDAWSDERILAMRRFVDQVVDSQLKYNLQGIRDFVDKKRTHQMSLHDKLTAYFEGDLKPDAYQKEKYFCSELVADCFVATGFIHPSAAVAYKSDTYSPGDLGRDPTFGTFVGYLSPDEDCVIPEDDEFYYAATFDEIFGESIPTKAPSSTDASSSTAH